MNEPLLRQSILRIGLIASAIYLMNSASGFWIASDPMSSGLMLFLNMVLWAATIVIMILAVVPKVSPRLSWMPLGIILLASSMSVLTYTLNVTPATSSTSDNFKIGRTAVELLEDGQNPYNFDYTDAFRVQRELNGATYFLDATIQHRVTYPALPMLTFYILERVGLSNPILLGVVSQWALYIILFVAAPKSLRPIILLPLVALSEMVSLPLFGLQDVVWSMLLVAMLAIWSRNRIVRAILFGLASTFRQQPWFIGPFLLFLIWHEDENMTTQARVMRIVQFLVISIGVFVLINLPFAIANPTEWLLSAFEPSYARFNPDGVGFNLLYRFGLLPLPRNFFSVLQFSTYFALLITFLRHPKRIGQGFWIFPAVFFWLYYRSLASYWYYWLPPMLLALTQTLPRNILASPSRDRKHLPLTMAVLVSVFALNMVHGAYYIIRGQQVEVTIDYPMRTFSAWSDPIISELQVTVTNRSDKTMRPRFFIQPDSVSSALPWVILSGEEWIEPRSSSRYQISASGAPERMLDASTGGLLAVTDAGADYSLYDVERIPAQRDILDPDAIRNGDFELWLDAQPIPTDWEVVGNINAQMQLTSVDNQPAVQINLAEQAGVFRLSQQIVLPDTLTLMVRHEENNIYGVEIDDGQHTIWVVFNPPSTIRDIMPADVYLVQRYVPLDMWSQQQIDLVQVYADFDLPLPPVMPMTRVGLQFNDRSIELSLLLASADDQATTGVFGVIGTNNKIFDIGQRFDFAIENPDQYYLMIGNEQHRLRNYERAIQAYETARSYQPNNQEVLDALAMAQQALRNFESGNLP